MERTLRLRQTAGPGAGREGPVTQRFVVGRGSDVQLALDDEQVSHHHAAFYPAGDGAWALEDLGSSNGTFVNGYQLTGPVYIDGGEEIRFGTCVCVATVTEAAPVAPAPAPAPPVAATAAAPVAAAPTPQPPTPPAPQAPVVFPPSRRSRGEAPAWAKVLAVLLGIVAIGAAALMIYTIIFNLQHPACESATIQDLVRTGDKCLEISSTGRIIEMIFAAVGALAGIATFFVSIAYVAGQAKTSTWVTLFLITAAMLGLAYLSEFVLFQQDIEDVLRESRAIVQ